MNKIIVYLTFLFQSVNLFAQWTVVHSDSTCYFNSIFFTDSLAGYVVGLKSDSTGNNSLIKKTINGGSNWITQTIPSCANQTLMSIFFTDSNHGVAVGGNGIVLLTFDGGNNWTCQNSGTTNNLWSIFFPSNSIGYAVGNNKTIVKTYDGGLTWNVLNSDTNNNVYYSVFFVDNNLGYIASSNGVLKSTDGGNTWINKDSSIYNPRSLYFVNSDTGFVCGQYYQEISKTTDGGDSWFFQLQNWNAYFGLSSIFFVNDSCGYAVGGYGVPTPASPNQSIVLKTINRGNSWHIDTTIHAVYDPYLSLNSVFFVNNDLGFVVGEKGSILKTTTGGVNWIQNNDSTYKNPITIYPNPVSEYLNINFQNNTSDQIKFIIEITDVSGRIIQRNAILSKEPFNISSLPTGIYIIKVYNDKDVAIDKFIKP